MTLAVMALHQQGTGVTSQMGLSLSLKSHSVFFAVSGPAAGQLANDGNSCYEGTKWIMPRGQDLGHRFLGLLQPGPSIHDCREGACGPGPCPVGWGGGGACADSAPDPPLHSARWGLVPLVFKPEAQSFAASLQRPSTEAAELRVSTDLPGSIV